MIEQEKRILTIDGVSKNFGGVKALDNLSFQILKGEILGLIGPNGSGKTTLFNLVTGVYRADEGRILINGFDLTKEPAYKIVLKGISRTFQTTRIWFQQTVINNIATGMIGREIDKKFTLEEKMQKVNDIIKLTNLGPVKHKPAGSLIHVEQRLLMIAIALATEPEVILLDEPTAGMSAEECSITMEIIKKIREKGMSVLLIEHNMRVAMRISDRIVAINFGHKIAEGTPQEISRNKAVVEAYLGSEVYA